MSKWTEAVWRPSEAHGKAMTEHRGLVVHIAEGFYEGTIAWQHNKANDVSSHFVVGRGSGKLAQVVDTDEQSWAQKSGNAGWLSVECEGFTSGHRLHPTHIGWERLNDWQIRAIAGLLVHAHHQYGVPLQVAHTPADRGLGHHSMGAGWGHQDCPGAPIIGQKAAIVALAKTMAATNTEDDMPTVNQIWDSTFGKTHPTTPLADLHAARDSAAAAAASAARVEQLAEQMAADIKVIRDKVIGDGS